MAHYVVQCWFYLDPRRLRHYNTVFANVLREVLVDFRVEPGVVEPSIALDAGQVFAPVKVRRGAALPRSQWAAAQARS